VVGFFRGFNTGKDNLSRYGIFHEFDPKNYETNCVVQAFQNSKIFRPDEVEFIRSVVKVWRIPLKSLAIFSQLFNTKIFLHGPGVSKRPFIPQGLKKPMTSHPEIRNVNFYVFRNHLMIESKDLENKLKAATFRDLTDDELNQIAWHKRYEVVSAVGYPACAIQFHQARPVIPWRDLDTFLTFDDLKEMENNIEVFGDYRELMIAKFQLDPVNYVSLAEFSAALFDPCLRYDTPELRGSVSDFIRRCNKPPILGARFGEVLKVEGDLVQLDRTGSYTSIYVSSPTPIGAPVLIEKFDPEAAYYFIQVEVVSFCCKHPEDPFPMLTSPGVIYADKSWWLCLLRHYNVEYVFISGYSFPGVWNVVGFVA
jgi:hypothetical protein